MIFNATNVKPIRGPSMHTSVGRYVMFNKKAGKLMGLNRYIKISFKIENGELLIYHDEEGILPFKNKQGNYRIHSKKLVSAIRKETNDELPTFEIMRLQKNVFELKLKPKPEL